MNKQIQQLLHVMQEKKIDYYLIPTSDFHNSEYVGDYFKVSVISPYSAGVVVGPSNATDSLFVSRR